MSEQKKQANRVAFTEDQVMMRTTSDQRFDLADLLYDTPTQGDADITIVKMLASQEFRAILVALDGIDGRVTHAP